MVVRRSFKLFNQYPERVVISRNAALQDRLLDIQIVARIIVHGLVFTRLLDFFGTFR
jgi:hypothetical protein